MTVPHGAARRDAIRVAAVSGTGPKGLLNLDTIDALIAAQDERDDLAAELDRMEATRG